MASRDAREAWWIIAFIVAICITVLIVGMVIITSVLWFAKAPPSPVITPITPSTVIEQLPPPEPRREDTTLGVDPTPSVVQETAPSLQPVQPELVAPSVPTPPSAVRAEVVEVEDKVEKVEEHLTETVEEFRKEADELDLGE